MAGVVGLLAIAVVIAAVIGGRSKMKLRQQKILLDNALEISTDGAEVTIDVRHAAAAFLHNIVKPRSEIAAENRVRRTIDP